MRAPAGFFELSALYPWVVAAGSVLVCTRCHAQVQAPLPRVDPPGYTRSCEVFLEGHRHCEAPANERPRGGRAA